MPDASNASSQRPPIPSGVPVPAQPDPTTPVVAPSPVVAPAPAPAPEPVAVPAPASVGSVSAPAGPASPSVAGPVGAVAAHPVAQGAEELRPLAEQPLPSQASAPVQPAAPQPVAPQGAQAPRKRNKVPIIAAVVVLALVVGFGAYKKVRGVIAESARGGLAEAAQQLSEADDGFYYSVDDLAVYDSFALMHEESETADLLDQVDDVEKALQKAQRALDGAKDGSWAFDSSDRLAVDSLQRCIDARERMVDSGRKLVAALDEGREGGTALSRLQDNLALFEGSVSAAIETINATDDIGEVDKGQLDFCVSYAKGFVDEMKVQMSAAEGEAAGEDLSAYKTHVEKATALLGHLQGYQQAVEDGDAETADTIADSFNQAMDEYLSSSASLPESTVTELSEDAQRHTKDYLDARGEAVGAAKDLRSYDGADLSDLSYWSALMTQG